MISREAAGPERPGRGGERDAEGNGRQSISRSERAATISAACRRAERSRAVRERYMTALRVLAAVRPETLELSPAKIVAALKILRGHLLPGCAADVALRHALDCRAERTLERFLRRNADLLAAVRRETRP